MKRTIKKQIWMTKAEAQDLQKKARKACMTEARLMRMLLAGYCPPEAPDDRFYDYMDDMRKLAGKLEAATRVVDDQTRQSEIMRQSHSILKLQNELEKKYLLPKESGLRWQ